VSKYYEAIKRSGLREKSAREPERDRLETATRVAEPDRPRIALGLTSAISRATSLMPLPEVDDLARTIAREPGIQGLTERLAPLALGNGPIRLLVSGCRQGDGASTVSTAIALDLSQRLSLRTLLVDAHLRHPSLHRLFPSPGWSTGDLGATGQLQNRATGWPRLDLMSCAPAAGTMDNKDLLVQFERLADRYTAVVIDIGALRLDARLIQMARHSDPILLIVRYGHTERQELATTASALRAADRSVAGVILNAVSDPVAKPMRRLLSQWKRYPETLKSLPSRP
jgi:protein-tyrosine kinase